MADLSVTAANVVPGADARTVQGVAGETITAGMAVYLASATGLWMKADADHATAEAQVAQGIALTGSSLNQPIVVQKTGDITIGATLTAGTAYYLSGLTAGGLCPVADVGTGERVVQIGLAKSTTVLTIDIQNPGVVIPA